ncbi:MAG: glycosyltransferase family 39 protein [Candidatus Margulisiibacteriota bacterium]|nr:glycosyltransferase family 39 protein [Candidatus Margulisiibacteriota bacterium]
MKNRTIIILLLIMVLQIFLRVPFLGEPLERDEGAYAYIAQRMAVGQVPYRDIYDHKPPAIYFIYAGIFKLFGESAASIRYFTLFYSLILTFIMFLIGSKLWGRVGGLLSAFFYAVFSGGALIQGTSANTETFLVLPILLALFFAIRSNNKWDLFWAGLFSGLAVMIKQVAFLNFLALFFFVVLTPSLTSFVPPLSIEDGEGNELRRRRKKGVRLLAGFAIFPLLFTLYFWLNNALPEFINVMFLENVGYLSHQPWQWAQFYKVVINENLILWFLSIIALLFIIMRERSDKNLLIGFWALFSIVGVILGKVFYGHYFIQAIPGLSFLSALVIINLKHNQFKVFILMITFIMAGMTISYEKDFYTASPDNISIRKYGINNFVVAKEVAAFVEKNTKPDQKVFIWGAEPEVYFYSNRASASRFIYYYPLFHNKARRIEMLKELKANRPKYIIWVNKEVYYKNLAEYLKLYYRQDKSIKGWRIWQRLS